MKKARFKIPGAVWRGLGRLGKWALVTLGREGIEVVIDKTTKKTPDDTLRITPARPVLVVDAKFKDALPLRPDVVRDEIARMRGQHL